MEFKVTTQSNSSQAQGEIAGQSFSITVGRSGAIEAAAKREGDGRTPLGTFKVLYGFYRPDRVTLTEAEKTHYSWLPIGPHLGWCDAPNDPAYNSIVPVGYPASHEVLWRTDSAYDRVLVISHNLPAVANLGSAVFIHQLHPGKQATAGCVALSVADMNTLLQNGISSITIT